jgi:urease accessory protein
MGAAADLEPALAAVPPPTWQGELTLGFAARGGGTALIERRHRGPLQVQRAFHPEGPGVCHVYLLHPPGGLVAGDQLEVNVQVAAGAHALLTTPASTKVYRSGQGHQARQQQRLQVAAGGRLEWLPQDTIVYEGAEAALSTRVELAGDAAFLGWEMVCLGRPAAGDRFTRGTCRQRFEVFRDGRPLVIERLRVDGGGPLQAAAWGLGGAAVHATMIATPAGPDELELARAALGDAPAGTALAAAVLAAATLVDGALVVRARAADPAAVRTRLERLWNTLRPRALGRPPCPPRIWLT